MDSFLQSLSLEEYLPIFERKFYIFLIIFANFKIRIKNLFLILNCHFLTENGITLNQVNRVNEQELSMFREIFKNDFHYMMFKSGILTRRNQLNVSNNSSSSILSTNNVQENNSANTFAHTHDHDHEYSSNCSSSVNDLPVSSIDYLVI